MRPPTSTEFHRNGREAIKILSREASTSPTREDDESSKSKGSIERGDKTNEEGLHHDSHDDDDDNDVDEDTHVEVLLLSLK